MLQLLAEHLDVVEGAKGIMPDLVDLIVHLRTDPDTLALFFLGGGGIFN
jgi:hypothetical protein